jgi:hypothetical protein
MQDKICVAADVSQAGRCILSSLFTPGATHNSFACIVVGLDTPRKKLTIETLFLKFMFAYEKFSGAFEKLRNVTLPCLSVCRSAALSVYPHATAWLLLDGFS